MYMQYRVPSYQLIPYDFGMASGDRSSLIDHGTKSHIASYTTLSRVPHFTGYKYPAIPGMRTPIWFFLHPFEFLYPIIQGSRTRRETQFMGRKTLSYVNIRHPLHRVPNLYHFSGDIIMFLYPNAKWRFCYTQRNIYTEVGFLKRRILCTHSTKAYCS